LTEAPNVVSWPRWSPDGQRLRFTVWDGVTTTANLWELKRDGALRQLFLGWQKANWVCCGEWTADGRYYLFQGDGQYWSVRERQFAGNLEPAILTTMGVRVYSAAVNPLSDTIYASVGQGEIQDIFRWDLNPTHTPSILNQELKTAAVNFSPDGQWIAYSHGVPTGYERWRARADGSEKLK